MSEPPHRHEHVPHRRFKDPDGRLWDLWEIGPGEIMGAGSYYDRRRADRDELQDDYLIAGWLCFESRGERRRFTPIPYGWEHLEDAVLRFLLQVAERVKEPERTQSDREAAE